MFVHYLALVLCIGVGVLPIGEIVAACPYLPSLPNTVLRCILPQNERITYCPGPDFLTPKGTIAYFQCSPDSIPADASGLGFIRCGEEGKWDRIATYHNFKCIILDNTPKIECGTSNYVNLAPLINHGFEADVTDWPWFAAIFTFEEDEWLFGCGGSLINPVGEFLVVLTAAHCLTGGLRESNMRVVLSPRSSDYLANEKNPATKANIYHVEKFEIHRNYSSAKNHEFDVGIIKLKGRIKLSRNILPVCWAGAQDSVEQFAEKKKSAILIGFGRDESGQISKTLKLSPMPVYTYKTCVDFEMKAVDTQFCAGYRRGAAACKGDSGSGLSFRNVGTGKFFVQGIVSQGTFNPLLGTCENVAIYTRISKFFLWIESITVKLDPEKPISVSTINYSPPTPIYSTSTTISTSTRTPSSTEAPTSARVPISTRAPTSTKAPTSTSISPTAISTSTTIFPNTSITTTTNSPPVVRSSRTSMEYYPNDYTELAIDLHNCYRSRHGAPEVIVNATLNGFAISWAQHLHRRGFLQSKSSMDYVTNEFSTTHDSHDPKENVRKAVRTWYNQIQNYLWDRPKPNAFSLMVWASVKSIGVGVVTVGSKTITVAAYSPPGNIIHLVDPTHHFLEKVLPLQDSRDCSL